MEESFLVVSVLGRFHQVPCLSHIITSLYMDFLLKVSNDNGRPPSRLRYFTSAHSSHDEGGGVLHLGHFHKNAPKHM